LGRAEKELEKYNVNKARGRREWQDVKGKKTPFFLNRKGKSKDIDSAKDAWETTEREITWPRNTR